jgi:chemotaxis protein methyltransferase CheR
MTLSPSDLTFVSDLVRRDSAIALTPDKSYLVEARLLPVARELGLASVSDLVSRLRSAPSEPVRRSVVEAMTTNETSWFRDRAPFQALAEGLLPRLLERRRTERKLRIWSAACSSGQEPYSLAIALKPKLAPIGFGLEILATDLSQQMVDRAQQGRYSQLEVNRGLPATELVRSFRRDGAGWQINDDLRRGISFRQLNLAAPLPPLAQMDVIFLRNVLIYFDAPTKAAVLQRVTRYLRPDGYLFLGAAETTINIDPRFQRVSVSGATVYGFAGEAAA